jgi:hypothetical protein
MDKVSIPGGGGGGAEPSVILILSISHVLPELAEP